ncbi:NAD(P)(+) transhydrogenase (Re/Si-specific) subunit beta [Ochrobactrum sp. Marseille-Q0166]|uniref:NAD(P)(+) transhydrogenase (Re/Si-specific) subunit beta n=1 Tax=Ochrobactrum sp. Marseille-Q0166 TaxID=2761105 RepID=UPI001654F4B5|nr:NAD(P)(+) transhydrogenase (Re/Si-specific) subunit beta [Ochrobactrum sp. Marseille-Q0166]MBC8718963.1 NAD(P)(+) transhydrogenase (Re/Si-specific) subunit beta [Ochrobactrum sp. Marseille-Q0166]
MIIQHTLGLSGLAAAALFIFGLKRMSSPVTALSGIVVAGVGMIVAVAASFLAVFDVTETVRPYLGVNIILALAALALGGGWAWLRGKKVEMTAIPQMVALYNGMGGGAAAAVAAVELSARGASNPVILAVTAAGALIGSISLTGSVIAWAKLDGKIRKPFRFRGQRLVNGALFTLTLLLGIALVIFFDSPTLPLLAGLFFLGALAFGIMMTLPIGGADMPVVISLYNAFTGLAVGLEGYALQNPALMIAGMVVGSAGTLLTVLMAKAMNRSLTNVLFSNFGDAVVAGGDATHGEMKSADASDAAIAMRYASSVVIIPGYGLAVAQAQQKLYEFVKLLQAAGVDVKFAIHPVAGRMPGHMNVLLAEAGVPYDIIYDMEDINADFTNTDVALVIGANDVVNPAARTDKSSPIYGMPILNADQAHQVYVVKRGQGKGYSGVENLLFFQENCNMVYGDAQAVLTQMVQAVKDLAA